jgi:Bacterial Ig domain
MKSVRIGSGVVAAFVLSGMFSTAALAAPPGKDAGTCNRKCTTTSSDTTPPTVSIATPSSGASVSGTVNVSGSATDNASVAKVEVSVDSGPAQLANGTSSWSWSMDTRTYAAGSHTVTAKATDASGTAPSTSVTVSVASASAGPDVTLADPRATHPVEPLGRGKMAESGSMTAVLYAEQLTSRRAVFVRDASNGATAYVDLPVDTTNGWGNANYAWSGTDFWVLGGGGPVYLRHYRFAGSPMPTSASLVATQVLGDSDSRVGDVLVLRSGGVVAVWHQQGTSGAQGLNIGYRSPAGAWQALPSLTFAPSAASKQVVVQHPADGSVWVFTDPDGWSAAGAVHLTEASDGLHVDWTDATFLSIGKYGDMGPDGENPDLAVAADPSTGTIALAYQNDHRYMFSTSPVVTGSYVSVARITATGGVSFLVLPVYVERVSALGLVVGPGWTALAYRPIDQATLRYDKLVVSTYRNGAWGSPTVTGTVDASSQRTNYGVSRVEVAAAMADGNTHFVTAG